MAENERSEVEEKLVKHMSYKGHEMLSTLLFSGNQNYRHLAGEIGFTTEEIRVLQEKEEPVQVILQKCPDLTFSKLKSILADMERNDVLEELKPFEADTPTPSKYNQLFRERICDKRKAESKNLTALPDKFKYDAFICYVREDIKFAKKLLKKLESAPYHLKLCIDYRDILAGGDELTTIVNVIEERCRKVVVVISKHFLEDEIADFQAKIALRLSPGCKEKRLIPILLDEKHYVPRILQHIYYLDYKNKLIREYFWPNLARSLGYTVKKNV